MRPKHMKHKLVSVLGLVALLVGSVGVAAAAPAHGGHGAGAFHGAAPAHTAPAFRGGAAVHAGRPAFHGNSGAFHHDGRFHDGHFHHGGRVFVGVGPVFPWWDPYPVYVAPPPVVDAPPVYVQPAPSGYWYYCPSAGAYYPNVSSCPEPWVPVPPSGG